MLFLHEKLILYIFIKFIQEILFRGNKILVISSGTLSDLQEKYNNFP